MQCQKWGTLAFLIYSSMVLEVLSLRFDFDSGFLGLVRIYGKFFLLFTYIHKMHLKKRYVGKEGRPRLVVLEQLASMAPKNDYIDLNHHSCTTKQRHQSGSNLLEVPIFYSGRILTPTANWNRGGNTKLLRFLAKKMRFGLHSIKIVLEQ